MRSTEELLTKILNHLADQFKGRLVLKGGMLLRLYNSPRSTQDIDYVLQSKESKKVWKEALEQALKELKEIQIEKVDLNSRGIFIHVIDNEGSHRAILEISVIPSTHLPSEPMSTADLSKKYDLAGRVVATMALPEAFSHKIAATLERNVVRDLYDLSQLEAMGTFDLIVLRERLSRLSIDREKPKPVKFSEATKILRKKLEALTQERVQAELYPLLPLDYQTGVLGVMRASVGRLLQRLAEISE
jgi:predicted nucleotidyltransferase component of viral defense system